MATIDLNLPLKELLGRNPELRDILGALGLGEVLKDSALALMGDIMTLPRAAAVQSVPLTEVVSALEASGYEVAGQMAALAEKRTVASAELAASSTDELPAGHPINLMRLENKNLAALLAELRAAAEANSPAVTGLVRRLNALRSHYAKKENLFMPLLYAYGVAGPSQVMWDEDDEIVKELGLVTRVVSEDAAAIPGYQGRIIALAEKTQLMMDKEEKILFTLSMRFFTTADWYSVYRDFHVIGMGAGEEIPAWTEADAWVRAERARLDAPALLDARVELPTGAMTVRQLRALLDIIPMDITYIDEHDHQLFFTNAGRVFTRPLGALGREVYDCHPPRLVPFVKQLIADFKSGTRDRHEEYRYIAGKPIAVTYLPVHDEKGIYLGTVELVQNCTRILEKFGAK